MREPSPQEVSTAIWAVARPFMATDRWCVNAASLTKRTLAELGLKSYPVHAEVTHLNAAYAEFTRDPDAGVIPGYEARVPEGQQPYMTYARLSVYSESDIGAAENAASPDGLPGHVLTYVPAWGAYLDPSAHQFSRPEHGIELPPGHVWMPAPTPPATCFWQRPDGGVSIIEPTGSRRFVHAPGWRRKTYHDEMVREIIALLANPPDGG